MTNYFSKMKLKRKNILNKTITIISTKNNLTPLKTTS